LRAQLLVVLQVIKWVEEAVEEWQLFLALF
jgi:hypothetical protein